MPSLLNEVQSQHRPPIRSKWDRAVRLSRVVHAPVAAPQRATCASNSQPPDKLPLYCRSTTTTTAAESTPTSCHHSDSTSCLEPCFLRTSLSGRTAAWPPQLDICRRTTDRTPLATLPPADTHDSRDTGVNPAALFNHQISICATRVSVSSSVVSFASYAASRMPSRRCAQVLCPPGRAFANQYR